MILKLFADPVKWGLRIENENNVTWQIIRAKTETEARDIAAVQCGDEGPDIWRSDAVIAEILEPDGPSGQEGGNAM